MIEAGHHRSQRPTGPRNRSSGLADGAAVDTDARAAFEAPRLVSTCWSEARTLQPGDEVDRYLRNLEIALPEFPRSLRYHSDLPYFEKSQGRSRQLGSHPALLACIQDRAGRPVNLHRTYLRAGGVAPVTEARKPLLPLVAGVAVRLFKPTYMLAVTVDVESALAIHLATNWPVWAALTPHNLRRLVLPPGLDYVVVFAANDVDERASARDLAARLRADHRGKRCLEVDISTPPARGLTLAESWACCRRQGARTWQEKNQGHSRRRSAPASSLQP